MTYLEASASVFSLYFSRLTLKQDSMRSAFLVDTEDIFCVSGAIPKD